MTAEKDEAIEPERDSPEEPYVHRGRPKDPGARALAKKNPLRRGLGILGPGLISGAADDDPSGIGTYAQGGRRVRLCDALAHGPHAALHDRRAVPLRADRAGLGSLPGERPGPAIGEPR